MDRALLGDEVPSLENQSNHYLYGILQRGDHKFVRFIFVASFLALIFTLGAGFYAFPMWLNFIVTDHCDFSRQALSSLGAVPFVGILGLACFVIIFVNWIKCGDKTSKFLALTFIASSFVVISWGLLLWLVLDTPADVNYSHFIIVFIVLLLMGTGIGIFFTVWLDKLFPLLKPQHHFVYGALCNMFFAFGSVFSLVAKLFMNGNTWLTMMTIIECAAAFLAFFFVFLNYKKLLIHTDHEVPTEVSTKNLIIELFQWKRQFDTDKLMTKDCTVRSSQFYWLIFSFTAVCTLATCFMANLGPLLSAESDSEDNFKAELIVLIWASAGQTFARIIIPMVAHTIGRHIATSVLEKNSATEHSNHKIAELIQLKCNNATTLPLTFIIGIVFFIFLLILWTGGGISFTVASTVISGAYGSMWVVTNAFPLFFPNYNYAVLLSFFQIFGMIGMIIFVLITSYWLELNNDGIFMSLLCASVVTMIVTGIAMIDRYLTEPASVSMEDEPRGLQFH